jgi:aryl-phospho-beta-D-glucosidase BglC (GH1 family)
MAALGANLLRLPVNPVWYRTRPDYRNAVATVIGWAEERRMYTLLDLHWSEPDGRSVCKPEMGNAARFWQEAAFDFRGRTSVIYDIYNEPCQIDWATWRPLAEQLVDAIRRVEPDALVVVPGVDWAYDLRGVAGDPVQRENIIYGAHDYPWKAYLDRERAYGYLADRYPVLLGEFGADYQPRYGFYQDPVEFTRGLLEFVDRRGLVGWAAWAWHAEITPNMFSDWQFTPTPFGQAVLDHLAAANAARAAPGPSSPAAEGQDADAGAP